MKICRKCREDFTDKFTKCIYCGGPLETVPVPGREEAGARPQTAELEKRRKGIRISVTAVIIMAVGILFAISQIADFNKSKPQLPQNASAKISAPVNLVFANAPKPEHVLATEETDQTIDLPPETAAFNLLKDAFSLCESGKCADPGKAIEYLDEAIKLKPDLAEAYNNRGNAYSDIKQYERAIEDYNEVIRLQPNFSYAYYNRGLTYSDLGRHQQAVEDFNTVIRLNPDEINAYYNRAAAYFRLGDKEAGCRDAQKACDLGRCDLLEKSRKKKNCE